VGENGQVSDPDDDQPVSGEPGATSSAGSEGHDLDDTRPLQPGPFGQPSGRQAPRPYGGPPPSPPPPPPPAPTQQPYGGPSTGPATGPATPYPGYGTPGPYAPGPQQPFPQQPFPQPGQYPSRRLGEQPQPSGRLPGWVWPVMTALALVVGALGGVLASVAVSSSLSDADVPALSTDDGAVAPLRADNGSIAAVADRLLPSTVQIQAKGGADGNVEGGATGSGFVLDGKDHVITNNHVVAGATGKGEIKVLDRNGRQHPATIVGRSAVYDIAVLDVTDSADLRPVAIGSSRRLRVGDTVVAIGSPLGLSSTVTSGIISATERPVTTGSNAQSSYINALQTDAAINPGNSGGPLVNIRGQVVGVNSAIATTGGAFGGEGGSIGVGFAIPMEQVRVTAAQILATGKARYPVIGANVNTGVRNSGAKVVAVPSGTPAAAAGLRKGDVVTSVNGKPITDGIGLIVAIRSHQPGETLTLAVKRADRTTTVRVKLGSKVD
jgi:putative serine protease PepD